MHVLYAPHWQPLAHQTPLTAYLASPLTSHSTPSFTGPSNTCQRHGFRRRASSADGLNSQPEPGTSVRQPADGTGVASQQWQRPAAASMRGSVLGKIWPLLGDLLPRLYAFMLSCWAVRTQIVAPAPAETLRRMGLILSVSLAMVVVLSAIDASLMRLYVSHASRRLIA